MSVMAARSIFVLYTSELYDFERIGILSQRAINRSYLPGGNKPKQSFCIRKLNQNLQKSNVGHFNIIHIQNFSKMVQNSEWTVWSLKWVRMRWDPIRREFRFVTRMMMSRQRRGRWYALSSFPETISKGKSTPFWFQNLKFSPPTAACTSNPL